MIKPIRRNVFLELLDDTDDFYEGTTIRKPETFKGFTGLMKVIALAEDCIEPISVGENVIASYNPEEIKEFALENSGKKYFIVREDHILCTITEIPAS